LVHFRPEEAKLVLDKMLSALNPGGRIAFSVKERTAETTDGFSSEKLGKPRYFHYYSEGDVKEMLAEAGLSNADIARGGGYRKVSWLTVISQKENADE
jgi:predicted TPR repeat methyltransferase